MLRDLLRGSFVFHSHRFIDLDTMLFKGILQQSNREHLILPALSLSYSNERFLGFKNTKESTQVSQLKQLL